MPQQSLRFLFDVSIADTNGVHIFRAIMGLYLGFTLFWIVGAFNVRLGRGQRLERDGRRYAPLVADRLPSDRACFWRYWRVLAQEAGPAGASWRA